MSALGDRIKMSSASAPGTGTVTLSAALQGYQTIDASGIPDGATSVPYALENSDRSLWETGLGTKVSATSFSRDLVTAGSSGAGVLVNFVTAPTFYVTPLASNLETAVDSAADIAALYTLVNGVLFEAQRVSAKAFFIDNGQGRQFFDSYDTTTFIDLATSTFEDVSVAGKISPTTSAVSAISGSTGTDIGNLVNPANARDGDTSEAAAGLVAKADTSPGVTRYIGKNYVSSPKTIWQVIVHGSSNHGYAFTPPATSVNPIITIQLRGKNAAAPLNALDGTLLGSTSFLDTTTTNAKTIESSDKITTWDYDWVAIRHNYGNNLTLMFAEVVFYTAPATINNLTLVSTLLLTAPKTVNKAYMSGEILFTNTPTLNTDLTYEVSTNNGTNYTALTMVEVGTSPDPHKKTIRSALTTIGTPAQAVKYRIKTLNNKYIELLSTELVIVYD